MVQCWGVISVIHEYDSLHTCGYVYFCVSVGQGCSPNADRGHRVFPHCASHHSPILVVCVGIFSLLRVTLLCYLFACSCVQLLFGLLNKSVIFWLNSRFPLFLSSLIRVMTMSYRNRPTTAKYERSLIY